MIKSFRLSVILACVLLILARDANAGKALATFAFEDHLNRAWSNELVFYPVDAAIWGRDDLALISVDGKTESFQWATAEQSPNGKASIAFLANVPKFSKASYSLQPGLKAVNVEDMGLSETATSVEISTAEIGLRLHRGEKALSEGPIAGLRLPSGSWIGSGSMQADARPNKHSVNITAKGPAFVDAIVIYEFDNQGIWKIRFRLIRGEAVVLIDETCDLKVPSSWRLSLSHGWSPERMLFRNSLATLSSAFGQQETWTLDGSGSKRLPAFVLEPWLHWNNRSRQGNWFSVYGEATNDMLMVGAIRAASWVDPNRYEAKLPQSPVSVVFEMNGDQLGGRFPLVWGRRQWMLGIMSRDAGLADVTKDPGDPKRHSAPLPQLLLIKHGDFPLDLIKDYQFEFVDDQNRYPRMMVRAADVEAIRQKADVQAMQQKIVDLKLTTFPITRHTMATSIEAYLITADPALAKHLCRAAEVAVQSVVDNYLKQNRLLTPGFAPHMRQETGTCLLLADAVMDSDQISPVIRRRIKAQAAFIGYTLNREDVYSPERGYAGFPNMTTSHYGYKAVAASFIPTHPLAKVWIDDALKEAREQIELWSDDNGGWLEAPHYAMVSYDALLGVAIMAHNAGLGGDLFHPKMRKVIEWFAKISTPQDSRFGGFRHLPPIGHTYVNEPTGEFGIIARLWRDRDPQFSKQMQWMFRQHRSHSDAGIGGSYPALAGYRALLLDPTIPEEAPSYGSELFPETGVILRNGFPGPRETQIHMIAGKHRSHYDDDSGSITFWGKGRILCDDFGYGAYSRNDHSMVEVPSATSNSMKIESYETAPQADYVSGIKEAWKRQILFVKDADPLGPNYVVLCDTLSQPDRAAVWRLWTTSSELFLDERSVAVTGKEDVDMDVHFALPKKLVLKQEEKSRTAGAALRSDGSQSKYPTTQNGIIVPMSGQRVVTALLLPHLKGNKAMAVTSLNDGRVMRVQTLKGEDWVFMSASPFTFRNDDIEFEGTVGLVSVRDGKHVLTLPGPGTLKYKGRILEKGELKSAK
jgi:hypothetical protein